MATVGFVDGRPAGPFSAKITASVAITCIVAATTGLIFGYDVGISGGVTTMIPFLQKFFPSILRKASEAKTNIYCIYNNEVLTAFTSSLYIAALTTSLVASCLTSALGRRNTMVIGGLTFLAGAAVNIVMLIIGRILLGFGLGFTNQVTAAPIYLSEMAPPKWRGAIGVLVAGVLNYFMAKQSYGWRISLGGALVPAAIMTIGALVISDTPSSLVERGKIDQARKSLSKVRGTEANVDAELDYLIEASEIAKAAEEEPFIAIIEKQYRPQLVMSIAIPFFQEVTGINIIAFYAPVLFRMVGFGSQSALMAAVILAIVNLVSITVGGSVVDRFGRRFLFIVGGIQMCICQVAIACVLVAATSGVSGTKHVSKEYAIIILALMCLYTAGFAWSWGPLLWLVSSEIFPMKIRSTGQSISVAVHFATTFVLSQTFLAMLGHFKYGAFLFYAGWLVVMTTFIVFFVPETKGIPLDSMYVVWEEHWFWRRFVKG